MELAHYFLYDDLEEFQTRFQRLLDRTPRSGGALHTVFWIELSRSIPLVIQDTQLDIDEKVVDVCLSSTDPNKNTQNLKLAFKIENQEGEYEVIFRSVSIMNIEEGKIHPRVAFSEDEVKVFVKKT